MKSLLRIMSVLLCAVVLSSSLCSCSNPEPKIIYIGPNGEVLEASDLSCTADNNANDETTAVVIETSAHSSNTNETGNSSESEATIETCDQSSDNKETEITDAIANAETYLSEGLYDDALLALFPVKSYNDPRVTEEENRINDYRPVALYELEPLTTTDAEYLDPIVWKSNYEINTGASGYFGIGAMTHETLSFDGYIGQAHGVTSVSFNYFIGDNCFEQLTGTFALSGETEEHKNTPFSLSMEVYADDILIFSSEELTAGSLPINILVDIPQGTQLLRISFVTSTTNISQSISADCQYGSAFYDCYLSKSYAPL